MLTTSTANFTKVVLEDINWARPLLLSSGYRTTEYNFTNTFNWQGAFGFEIARLDDFAIIRATKPHISYLFPAGNGDVLKAVNFIIDTAKTEGYQLRFHSLTSSAKEFLEQNFPEKFDFIEKRKYFDYIYSREKLATLSGKKLHSKRNHINRFEQENPTWRYESINAQNCSTALAMCLDWYVQLSEEKDDSITDEREALKKAFANFEKLCLKGGMIFTGEKCVAVTVGSAVSNNTIDVHFEKAYPQIQGAYAIINREFVKNDAAEFEFINREDDMGLEGLRKAKESYQPAELLEKFNAAAKA